MEAGLELPILVPKSEVDCPADSVLVLIATDCVGTPTGDEIEASKPDELVGTNVTELVGSPAMSLVTLLGTTEPEYWKLADEVVKDT